MATIAPRESKIPVVDISAYMGGELSMKASLGQQIDDACRRIGFFVIVGHQISDTALSRVRQSASRFFDRPAHEKMRFARDRGDGPGYRPYADSALARSLGEESPPDLKENFVVGPLRPSRSDGMKNIWPDAAFGEACSDYYREMEYLSEKLLEVFATALGVDAGFFGPTMQGHSSLLSIINYPELTDEAAQSGQLRAGAHTDYGTLTVLAKDPGAHGGLQVRSPLGRWLDVEPPRGSFVVNIGDLMARWTNDRWVSTMHRVVNPPRDEAASRRRISIAFFNQPAPAARVAPIPTCVTSDRPARYPEVQAGAYLSSKRSSVRPND